MTTEFYSGIDYGRLKDLLSRVTEVSVDSGTATGGSITTVVDSGKNWEINMWADAIVEVYVVADAISYLRTIASNTATTLTIVTLPAGKTVDSGDNYSIRKSSSLVDVDKWGGTALTGRDISLDTKALIDASITGLLKSLGDIVAEEALIARIGQTTDAMVAAGAVGSSSAKLRRLTQGAEDLKTMIVLAASAAIIGKVGIDQTTNGTTNKVYADIAKVLGTALSATNPVLVRLSDGSAVQVSPIKTQLPTTLTGDGNLKQSIEEQAIAVGADIQAHYALKSTRDITTPANDAVYYLPISPSGTHTPAGASATIMTDANAAFVVDELIGKTIYNETDVSSGVITDNDATTITVTALAGGTGNNWEQNDVYHVGGTATTYESIDLSNYNNVAFYIKKATNKTANIELEISLDGGTTFALAEGYIIETADFVLATWNSLSASIPLAQARLKVTAGATGAGKLEMAVIRQA